MDDLVLVEPDLGLRPRQSEDAAEDSIKQVLGKGALNHKKKDLEGRPEQEKLIWGLLYSTVDESVSMPLPKVEKAYHLLNQPCFDQGYQRPPRKEIEALRGNQQYWLIVRPELGPMLGATVVLLGVNPGNPS
eukprot:1786700-Heterocapsa_arctica.AAC.1